MSQAFLNTFIQSTQQGIIDEVQHLIEEQHIEEDIAKEAQKYAQQIVDHQKDPSRPLPPEYKGIDLNKDPMDKFAYLLVLEYLESIGLKFAPSVLRYESRHESLLVSREDIAKQFCLRAYDRTPLLVQMIEQTKLYHQNNFEEEEEDFGEEEALYEEDQA